LPRTAPPQPYQLQSGEKSDRRQANERGPAQQHFRLLGARRAAGCPTAGAGTGAQQRRLEQKATPTPNREAVAASRGTAEREVEEARRGSQQREERCRGGSVGGGGGLHCRFLRFRMIG